MSDSGDYTLMEDKSERSIVFLDKPVYGIADETQITVREDIVQKSGLEFIFEKSPSDFDKIDQFYRIYGNIRKYLSAATNELAFLRVKNNSETTIEKINESQLKLKSEFSNIKQELSNNREFITGILENKSDELFTSTIQEIDYLISQNYNNVPKKYIENMHSYWLRVWDNMREPKVTIITNPHSSNDNSDILIRNQKIPYSLCGRDFYVHVHKLQIIGISVTCIFMIILLRTVS
jgi:hypothetical protein